MRIMGYFMAGGVKECKLIPGMNARRKMVASVSSCETSVVHVRHRIASRDGEAAMTTAIRCFLGQCDGARPSLKDRPKSKDMCWQLEKAIAVEYYSYAAIGLFWCWHPHHHL